MARNIEIKARLAATGPGSLADLQPAVQALADAPPEPIAQDDTFFACRDGRLKLRVFADGSGELIAYRRPDVAGPKASDYRITVVADPASMRETLGHALGQVGRVVKQRTLLLVGRTRVHLDRVAGLGDFLELEVVLADGESEADGVAVAHGLLRSLGVTPDRLVARAYVDLLGAQARGELPDAPAIR